MVDIYHFGLSRYPPIWGHLRLKEQKKVKYSLFQLLSLTSQMLKPNTLFFSKWLTDLTLSALFIVLDAECKTLCHDAEFLWGPGSRGFSKWLLVMVLVLASEKGYSNIFSWFCVHSFLPFSKSQLSSIQFISVAQSCPTLCDPVSRSTPGLPVHHQLRAFTQTHVHWVSDAIQPSHPVSSPSPPAPNPSQHLGLFQWVNSSHEVAKVLEFQLWHLSFQWTPRADLL